MTATPWTLPNVPEPRHAELAAAHLAAYFRSDSHGFPKYTGSRFERFAGGGDRPDVADVITADDLVAVSMLSVDVKGHSALRLLGDQEPHSAAQIGEFLRQLPTTVSLVDASDTQIEVADRLWIAVRRGCEVGRTRTSKLLARKRPHLLPVIDSVVRAELGHADRRTDFYVTLRSHLNDDNRALADHLAQVRSKSAIGEDISLIRCFDILVWMAGHRRI